MSVHSEPESVAARWQIRTGDLRAMVEMRIPHRFRSVLSADDVLQDAWLIVSRGIPDDVRNFDAWITTVVENRLLDALRIQRSLRRGGGLRRLNGPGVQWSQRGLIAPTETPSRGLQRQEAVFALQTALAHLSASSVRVLRWRFFDELSLDEIERRSGCSKAAVRGRIYRAFQQLARGVRRLAGPLG